MNTANNTTRTVILPSGQEVLDLLNMQSNGQGALVDLSVLSRLTKHLPTVPLAVVKAELVKNINTADTLEEVCLLLEGELAFHHTVNIIKVIDMEPAQRSKLGEAANLK